VGSGPATANPDRELMRAERPYLARIVPGKLDSGRSGFIYYFANSGELRRVIIIIVKIVTIVTIIRQKYKKQIH
jgi:hypothetical protein